MSSSVLKGTSAQALPRIEWRVSPSGARSDSGPAGRGPEAAGGFDAGSAARLEKEAYARGFHDGEAAGARQSLDQLNRAIQAFAQTASELGGFKTTLRREVERELVALSVAIARKILKRELSLDPHIVLAVVRSCLDELQNIEIYRLQLNPQDVQPVAAFLQGERATNIEIVPDPRITRGGAIFETAQGKLDAQLESQLSEIERGLADR